MSRIVDDVMHVLRQNGIAHPMRESDAVLGAAIEENWREIHRVMALRETEIGWIAQALAELVCAEQRDLAQSDRLREAWREKSEILKDIRSVADKHTQLG